MKLINSSAKFIPQAEGLSGIYKQIELCGRTCYKSENLITDSSADKFVDRLINSNHTAMLEHGTVYLIVSTNHNGQNMDIIEFYINNPYSTVVIEDDGNAYITTNLRVIVENDLQEDLEWYRSDPTKFHIRRYTFKFICDRGVSHELVRHRTFSFAQESTRYCNYNKEKFNKNVSFIIPSWSKLTPDTEDGDIKNNKDAIFYESCKNSEELYFKLLFLEATAQEARQVLPNALKTEICMTGFASDWRYFFDLRLFGKTGAPHPDMKLLAEKIKEEAENVGIWEDIMKYSSKFK